MTVQRILLHAVAVATLGAVCTAQSSTQSGSSTGTGSTSMGSTSQQQQGSQQPAYQQGQQSGSRQQSGSQEGQAGGHTHYGQSGTSTPSSMSGPSATQGTSSTATGSTTATGKSPDHLFITKAAQGGLAEVELGNLAQQKAKSEEVKQFAGKMANDHSQANAELKQLAARKGITLPSALSAKDKQTKKTLSSKSGAEFDKAYMRDMVQDHEKDVAEFRKQAESGKDPEVKAFAQKKLPTLEQHLAHAKEIARKVGAGHFESTGAAHTQHKPGAMSEPADTNVQPGTKSKPAGDHTHPY